MDMKVFIADPRFLFFIGFLGIVSHFLNKFKNNELKVQPGTLLKSMYSYFFKTDVLNTIMTLIAYIVVFFITYQQGIANIYTVFVSGYMADSLLNKAEQTGLKI